MNEWFARIDEWHHATGCEQEIVSWRTASELGVWLMHGRGEARRFSPDSDLMRSSGEQIVDGLIEWLQSVHDYEMARA